MGGVDIFVDKHDGMGLLVTDQRRSGAEDIVPLKTCVKLLLAQIDVSDGSSLLLDEYNEERKDFDAPARES